MDSVVSFLASEIRIAMPILIAALGLVFSERAGIVNIGIEGIMLIGAFAGYAGTVFTGSVWLGLFIAVACGVIVGIIFSFLVVTVRANQTVIGAALNIFGTGLTVMLNRILFDMNQAKPAISGFRALKIPLLSEIPFLGEIFFNQNPLVYIVIIILIASNYVMFKTELGLSIRAVGENPRACDTVGLNVYRLRYGCTIYSGAMAGFAGAYLSTALMSSFTEGMSSGRGFIALAAVIFGRWKPGGVLVASLIFGAGEALQYKLSAMSTNIPYQFLQMAPYILTLLALVGVVGKVQPPKASGQPYIKE
jgi:ABC-type uncharacterized transport system permease subunit